MMNVVYSYVAIYSYLHFRADFFATQMSNPVPIISLKFYCNELLTSIVYNKSLTREAHISSI